MEEKTPKPRRGFRSKATKEEKAAPTPQPEKKDTEKTAQPQSEKNDSRVIKVEIQKYKSLVDALGEYRPVFRAILTIFLVGVLLFTGITAVVIAIKRFYPYSDIVTNTLGATTLKNEDKEVSYWLLNTADLWAKSGIMVKKGQTITVRASGKKHTAMHHLYDDAHDNAPDLQEPWVGTKGFSSKEDFRGNRDATRAKYKIFPEENQDALLMQIVPVGEKPDVRPRYLKRIGDKYEFVDSEHRFIIIGDRQENIYIDRDGILFFAINDIVLDDATIIEMMWNIKKKDYDTIFENDTKRVVSALCDLREKSQKKYIKNPNPIDEFNKDKDSYKSFLEQFVLSPDEFKKDNTKEIKRDTIIHNERVSQSIKKLSFGDFAFGTTRNTDFIELYGYFMFKYQTPWYDDNLGSFLIVVESSSN